MRTVPETRRRSVRGGGVPPSSGRRRWWKTGGLGVLILALIFGGLAGALYIHAKNRVRDSNLPGFELPISKGPLNILVLGSDSREGLSAGERKLRQYRSTAGRRSDTLMLVHLFGDGKHAVILSFPRDLRVEVPNAGIGKINSAYNFGPERVVETVKTYTGLEINHYVEVNFAGFRKIVNSLGGVRICTTRAYEDKKAGLDIPKRGCYTFNGDTALAWARSRSIDPDGDFGRIRRQQQLIRVMLQKATSLTTLLNPLKARGVIDSVSKNLVTDANFTLDTALGLAGRLKNAREGNPNVDFRTVPSFPKYIGGTSYVLARQDEAQELFDAIKADVWPLPPYGKTSFSIPEPADVSVRIVDASGRPGIAQAAKEQLGKAGFDVLSTIKTATAQAETQIYHRPGDELKARLVSEEFPDAATITGGRADPRADVTIYLGRDLEEGG